MASDTDQYRKFFDDEFEKYYKALSADFPIDIDVSLELNRRFKDYEVRLESNESKVSWLEIFTKLILFVAKQVWNDKRILQLYRG